LPDVTPPLPDWNPAQCVVFIYKYPILPHGLLPRFITKTHKLSEGHHRWRSGVVLADDGAEALVRADHDANSLTVCVRGPHVDARRALVKVVRHHLQQIHLRITGLNPKEEVALSGHPDVTMLYQDLILDERDGNTTIRVTVGGQREDRGIAEFLDGVESREE